MTPSRSVFRHIYSITQKTMDTYDYLPDSEAKYPFCFVDFGHNYAERNNDVLGRVVINAHWFGQRKHVKQIDKAIVSLHDDLLRTKSFLPYHMKLTGWRDRPQPEAPDSPGIVHFVAEIEITYTRKEV